jgi:hypothetical protein
VLFVFDGALEEMGANHPNSGSRTWHDLASARHGQCSLGMGGQTS